MRRANAIELDWEHSFRKAESAHREVDNRLRELGRRAYLTPSEQREVIDLKKRRLWVKDQLSSLRSHQSG